KKKGNTRHPDVRLTADFTATASTNGGPGWEGLKFRGSTSEPRGLGGPPTRGQRPATSRARAPAPRAEAARAPPAAPASARASCLPVPFAPRSAEPAPAPAPPAVPSSREKLVPRRRLGNLPRPPRPGKALPPGTAASLSAAAAGARVASGERARGRRQWGGAGGGAGLPPGARPPARPAPPRPAPPAGPPAPAPASAAATRRRAPGPPAPARPARRSHGAPSRPGARAAAPRAGHAAVAGGRRLGAHGAAHQRRAQPARADQRGLEQVRERQPLCGRGGAALHQGAADPPLRAARAAARRRRPVPGHHLVHRVQGRRGGALHERPALRCHGRNLVFEDEITALQPEVDKLKTLNVNKIIALGHSGFEMDKLIAQKVKGVDIVVGGHSNTFLYTGTPPSKEVPAGKYPFIVTSDDGRKVPVVQAYAFGKYLGYLKVEFDEKGNVIASHGNPILLNSSILEDPSIKADINKWRIKLDNYSTQELGKTVVYLDGSTQSCRFKECNMGNLICDAMINNNIRHSDEVSWNHVSMCILNGGAIRSPIDERNNGTITWENLAAVLPFGETFDLIQLKGSTLKKAFEHSVHRYGQSTGEFLQVGGIHVVYDLSRKPGNRVVKIDVLCTQCRVPSYEPLRMDKIYKVVLPSFLANGGDGFQMIKDEALRHDSGDEAGGSASTKPRLIGVKRRSSQRRLKKPWP
uniref:5'-nucleotidase n=1 Tax=Canis lupus familiaris TaxID=9615 RepID=A0A8C0NB61_CANLF